MQEELDVAQTRLASYFFISFEFPIPCPSLLSSICRTLHRALSDMSSHMRLHTYVGVRVPPVTTHGLLVFLVHDRRPGPCNMYVVLKVNVAY